MSKNLVWKFILIAVLLVLAILEVAPPTNNFRPDKLKPGIDLAGGTSVLYQVDSTGLEQWEKRGLAQTMIRILRQRTDPANNRGLIWRAQGNDRIEIQMPLATRQTQAKRQDYRRKLAAVTQNNISIRDVRRALMKSPENRRADFAELAGDKPDRVEKLAQLGQAHDLLESAGDQLGQARASQNDLRKQLDQAAIPNDGVDALVRQWDTLSDPNRQAGIAALVTDDDAEKAAKKTELITNYITARRQLSDARRLFEQCDASLTQAWEQLESLNIDAGRLEKVLASLADARTRKAANEQIEQLKLQHAELEPKINELVEVYLEYAPVAGRLDDTEDLKRLLKGSGMLEFRILPFDTGKGKLTRAEIQRYREALAKYGPTIKSGDEDYVWRKVKSPETFKVADVILAEFAGEVYVLAANGPEETLLHEAGPDTWRLKKARVGTDQFGKWSIDFSFNPIGAGRFWNLTRENLQRPLCILLDDEAISAPNIRSAISERGEITGNFTVQEVQDLVDKLNAGSLPARLGDEPISTYSVGPTVGRDNLQAGLRAGIIGLIAVAAFMVVYYMISGVLSGVALFMNLLLILGVMAFSRSTFTMAGIAGLILTIGMSVDANVLIFERIREEQGRGSSLRMAIRNGYDRALRTILDANITTFMTALILYIVASEEVKGFALTLMIGIVSSMFTALFVTRTVFDFLTQAKILQKKLHMLRMIGRPEINWMAARKIFWAVSIVLVVAGWAVFIGRDEEKNTKYSIEFTGGTSVHLALANAPADVGRAEVQELITSVGSEMNNPELEAARVQRVGEPEKREFEVVTTATNLLDLTVNSPAEGHMTAEQLAKAVRQAALDVGDNRLAEVEVQPGSEPGAFTMTTSQTNLNIVHRVLIKALKSLAPVKYTIEEAAQGDSLAATLTMGPQSKLTAEEISQIVQGNALRFADDLTAKSTVKASEQPDRFVLETEQDDKDKVAEILDESILTLSQLTYNIGQTKAIVTDAVRQALHGMLDIQEDLQPRRITAQPITDELIRKRPYLSDHIGGVHLTAEFTPPNTETLPRLQERFEQSRFKAEMDQYGAEELILLAPNDVDVTSDQRLDSIEVAVVSPELMYDAEDPDQFEQFAETQKKRLGAILSWSTSLSRVNQIDPSVGRRSMNQAIVAIVLSLGAIIIYIWVRFGNLRFGLAAVAALIHDVSIAIGLVAASAWISTTPIGKLLLIGDFKIDLPMIAAFLTVIGYSLNDTIVVFDRIRENRGKLATLSPDIINASVNQTLSRTVLTSLTTLLVLVVMYIWGGPGLRGFNFVLIIGVVVGTYSSIGIATPLLYGANIAAKTRTTDKKQV